MSIYEDMKGRLQEAGNLAEGSFALDNLAAVAAELERLEELGIEYMPNRFFPTLAWGEDLTVAAENFGVTRREAAPARVELTLTGEPGTAITPEMKAAAGELIYTCAAGEIGEDGKGMVTAVCDTPGAGGNVPAGAIGELVTAYAGIDSVTNEAAAYGGMDEESDEDLLRRVRARWENPSTGGNRGDYLRWALSVPGVSRAKVRTPGPGQVEVHILAAGNSEAGEALVAEVTEYIEAQRPLGAAVTVRSGEGVQVDVDVTALLGQGYDARTVQQAIAGELGTYLASLSFEKERVSYLKIADLLFVEGVEDVAAYTLNGDAESIALAYGQFPQLGEVAVHAGG